MKFNASLFVLLGMASAAPVKRSVAAIQSAVSTVSEQLNTLDTDVKVFTGSILQGLSLVGDVTTLESDITTATTDVTSTGALSAADSGSVYTSLTSLATLISTVLADVQSKASTVASAGFTSLVLGALKGLQSDADGFFTAIESTVDPSYASQVTALGTSVDTVFAAAIAVY